MRCLQHTARFARLLGVAGRPLSRPGALHDAVGTQVWNFPFGNGICFVQQLLASPRAAAALEDATVQGRAAFRDSSGSENISKSGSSGFCGDCWVRESQPSEKTAWTHAWWPRVASAVLQDFSVFKLGRQECPTQSTSNSPVQLRLPNLFCALMFKSCGAGTLPAHASEPLVRRPPMLHAPLEFALFQWGAHLTLSSEESEL